MAPETDCKFLFAIGHCTKQEESSGREPQQTL